jgi:hypothetical protein
VRPKHTECEGSIVVLVVVVPGPGVSDGNQPSRVVTALSGSLRSVRGRVPAAAQMRVLDFDDLFARDVPPAEGRAAETSDLTRAVVHSWWRTAGRISPAGEKPRSAAPSADVDETCRELGASAHFKGAQERPMLEADALSRYLTEVKLRHEARDRTQNAITPGTRVVIGHGLGALIAYEALCALGDEASVTLVTLGAVMCGSAEVFARLEPPPRDGQGLWPASVRRWYNIVAHRDPTAMAAPQLTSRFGPGIEDEVIEVKTSSGQLNPYLQDRSTARAVAAGLA